jgi:L-malate glycosyltransferase
MRSSKPVHIVFVTGTLAAGGTERHLSRLLTALDREKFSPELVLLRAVSGSLLAQVRAAGIPVHDLKWSSGRSGFLRGFARLRILLRRLNPDIIHAYGYPGDVCTAVIGARMRAKVVSSRRGNEMLRRRQHLYSLTNPFVDSVACVARSAERHAFETERFLTGKTVVIPNGIDTGGTPSTDRVISRVRRIGTLGRIRHVKGTDLLLDAFSMLSGTGLELLVAGPARDAWGTDLQAKYEGVGGIRFLGELHEAETGDFLNGLDLFVLPSRSEGMSNALLEAMAYGLPIVATDVGSNRELLGDGAAGVIVKPDASLLAEAMSALIQDPSKARRLARNARLRVAGHYRFSAMISQFEWLYESLAIRECSGQASTFVIQPEQESRK